MENSPITKAHDHARAAAVATHKSADTTVAISEHTQAAGEFANAALSTSSAEALRTLRLLEAHHQRLAELLKDPPEPAATPLSSSDQVDEKHVSEKDAIQESRHVRKSEATTRAGRTPSLPKQRYASREMSSSIANNLASARGIRSSYRVHPLNPSVSNDQAPGNVDPHPRRDASKTKMQSLMEHQPGKPTWVPPTSVNARPEGRSKTPASPSSSSSSPRPDAAPPVVEDDGAYGKFYNTFGSLFNKISAPLAFAGLPLIQEESASQELPSQRQEEQHQHQHHHQQPSTEASPPSKFHKQQKSTSASLDPDLSKIYSKATMKALAREGHAPHESFYVVPTSGHTMSYANILSYAEKEKRRLAHGDSFEGTQEDEDDFVDARETPISLSSLSAGAKRRVGRGRTERELNNTIEELHTENQSLKDVLDKLSKRLQMFETSAQSSAMALAESYRLMRPSSPNATTDEASRLRGHERGNEVEEQLASVTKQMEKLERDNRKMQKTLEKYREKWELLKAGAKARRDGQRVEEDET